MVGNGFLNEDIKITVDDATVAGTSAVDSTALDMTGYDGVLFIVKLGTAAANNTAKGQEDTGSSMATVQDLLASKVSSSAVATLKTLVLDIQRPQKQWVRVEVARGTSTTVDAIVAIQYKARNLPVAQAAASVALKQLSSPAEGTA